MKLCSAGPTHLLSASANLFLVHLQHAAFHAREGSVQWGRAERTTQELLACRECLCAGQLTTLRELPQTKHVAGTL